MMTKNDTSRLWYVVHTRSRFENVVHDGFLKKSMETFLPKIRVVSKRRDRKATYMAPLFPGYVFVKVNLLDPDEYLSVLKTAGTVRLIGNTDGPQAVLEEAVASLKIMVSSDEKIITGNQLQKGDPVMVLSGPLAGMTGIFVQHKGKGRIMVNIDALGQFASVEVDADNVERLSRGYL